MAEQEQEKVFAFAPGFVQCRPGQKGLQFPILITQGGAVAFDFKLKFNPDVFTNLRVQKGERACGGLWNPETPDVLTKGDWGVFGNQIYDEYNVCMYVAGSVGFVAGGEAVVITVDISDKAAEGVYTIELASAQLDEEPIETLNGFAVVYTGNDPWAVYQASQQK
jgi:hypothetical protein